MDAITNFERQVLQAIEASGQSLSAISKATGVARDAISRFRSGKASLNSNSLGRIVDHLFPVLVNGKAARAGVCSKWVEGCQESYGGMPGGYEEWARKRRELLKEAIETGRTMDEVETKKRSEKQASGAPHREVWSARVEAKYGPRPTPPPPPPPPPVEDQMTKFEKEVIEAIKSSGESLASLARSCDVTREALSKFANRKAGLSSTSIGRILDHLGYVLTDDPVIRAGACGSSWAEGCCTEWDVFIEDFVESDEANSCVYKGWVEERRKIIERALAEGKTAQQIVEEDFRKLWTRIYGQSKKPDRCRLSLSINGTRYTVKPIISQDDNVLKAFRLSRPEREETVVYDVAETIHGAVCTCPDFIFRRDGLDPRGCLHIRSMRALNLLKP